LDARSTEIVLTCTDALASILFVLVGTALLMVSLFSHQWRLGRGIFGDDQADQASGVISVFSLVTLLRVTIKLCLVATLLMMLWLLCIGFGIGSEPHQDEPPPLGAGVRDGYRGLCVPPDRCVYYPTARSKRVDRRAVAIGASDANVGVAPRGAIDADPRVRGKRSRRFMMKMNRASLAADWED
jgi:hypothetical protein